MRYFECYYNFKTTVQTHGRDEEGAIENVRKILHDKFIFNASNALQSTVGYGVQTVKEVDNGWFELTLSWSGHWVFEGETKDEMKNVTQDWLVVHLPFFYRLLENLATKSTRFSFIGLTDESVGDISIVTIMKNFKCPYSFKTVVQTHGRDEDGAIENIKKILDGDFVNATSLALRSGIDYEPTSIKEVDNGWFELELRWSSCWNIDTANPTEARNIAEERLDNFLTPVYQALENMATESTRFSFINLKDKEIDDILDLPLVTQ